MWGIENAKSIPLGHTKFRHQAGKSLSDRGPAPTQGGARPTGYPGRVMTMRWRMQIQQASNAAAKRCTPTGPFPSFMFLGCAPRAWRVRAWLQKLEEAICTVKPNIEIYF
jgi:hypothetical protein